MSPARVAVDNDERELDKCADQIEHCEHEHEHWSERKMSSTASTFRSHLNKYPEKGNVEEHARRKHCNERIGNGLQFMAINRRNSW